MNCQVVVLCHTEQFDQVQRIAVEDVFAHGPQPARIDNILAFIVQLDRATAKLAEQLAHARRLLELLGLENCRHDPGQVAYILGDQKVVLHETFDRLQAAV